MANLVYIALVYFLASIPSLLVNYHAGNIVKDASESASKPSYINNETETFDFIIIGGGSSGAVIANRLSKYSSNSVLVLERGGRPTLLSSIPYLWLYLARIDTGSVARYFTVPQPGVSTNTGGIIVGLAGKTLDGTSTINQMVYTRGNPKGYDSWVAATGDSDWSYNKLLPYFKKSEDYHGAFSNPLNTSAHGVGGELYIEGANLVQPSASLFFNAVQEKGYVIKDLNADQAEGFSPFDFNIKNGKRWGTYEAFLEPILGRSNLAIYPYSTATKIHFDANNKAYAVSYTRHGQTRFVRARKEIIISAGTFESPKLLMLSGVGAKDDLTALGIESKVDLPAVGRNFQDHLLATIQVKLNQNVTFVPERDLTTAIEAEYLTTGYGPTHNMFATLGFKSSAENGDPSWPDIEYFVSHQTDPGLDPVVASSETIRNDTNTVAMHLIKPKSSGGFVKLKSSNPDDTLIIDSKHGSNPSDINRLIEGIKFIVDLYENSNTYSSIGASLIDVNFPATCKALPYRGDAYWDCVARALATAGHQFTGTCSMGKGSNDPNAVLDSKLNVIGTSNLRVADASVMPSVPSGNTHASAIMIGERAADLILRRWCLLGLCSLLGRK